MNTLDRLERLLAEACQCELTGVVPCFRCSQLARLLRTAAPDLLRAMRAADAASLQYGATKGRKIPEMEMLGTALAPIVKEEE